MIANDQKFLQIVYCNVCMVPAKFSATQNNAQSLSNVYVSLTNAVLVSIAGLQKCHDGGWEQYTFWNFMLYIVTPTYVCESWCVRRGAAYYCTVPVSDIYQTEDDV